MAIRSVQITIEGQTALLMHRYPMEPLEAIEKKPIAEQAEHAAYRDPDTKHLYIPGINIQRAFVNGATYSKGKGRGSLQKSAAACLMVMPERVSLGAAAEYLIDSRPVVVPATKGRIQRHRPRLDTWKVSFTLEFDDSLLSIKQLRTIVDDTGTRVGLLDFRPARNGPFGKFKVVAWGE